MFDRILNTLMNRICQQCKWVLKINKLDYLGKQLEKLNFLKYWTGSGPQAYFLTYRKADFRFSKLCLLTNRERPELRFQLF